MIELWSINKVLRWTGFRVVVEVPASLPPDMVRVTKIGVKWVGLYGSEGWMRWEPWTRPFWSRWRGAAAACDLYHHFADDPPDTWTPPVLIHEQGRCVPADRSGR